MKLLPRMRIYYSVYYSNMKHQRLILEWLNKSLEPTKSGIPVIKKNLFLLNYPRNYRKLLVGGYANCSMNNVLNTMRNKIKDKSEAKTLCLITV